MLKVLGGVVIGIFVGALAVEIINRTRPNLIRSIEDKAEQVASNFLDAFKEGYSTRGEKEIA